VTGEDLCGPGGEESPAGPHSTPHGQPVHVGSGNDYGGGHTEGPTAEPSRDQ